MNEKQLFRFKHFSIDHNHSAHKVGTDGVLLGAWADVNNVSRILDVGTGSGVIALMMAQRTMPHVLVDAIDISLKDCEQAKENVEASPWPKNICVKNTALQKLKASPYDLIISNPPFFIDSAKPPTPDRTRARHTETLPPEELLFHAKRLLSPQGKLCLILPVVEAKKFIALAENTMWHCTRLCEFRARASKPVERSLFELRLHKEVIRKESLILYGNNGEWSDGYKNLTKDFYLKL